MGKAVFKSFKIIEDGKEREVSFEELKKYEEEGYELNLTMIKPEVRINVQIEFENKEESNE